MNNTTNTEEQKQPTVEDQREEEESKLDTVRKQESKQEDSIKQFASQGSEIKLDETIKNKNSIIFETPSYYNKLQN